MSTTPNAREMSAPDLLKAAAKLIERALLQLDVTEVQCNHCGLKRADNYGHMQVHRALHEIPRRLREHAFALTHPK